jgi:hypothetical protein
MLMYHDKVHALSFPRPADLFREEMSGEKMFREVVFKEGNNQFYKNKLKKVASPRSTQPPDEKTIERLNSLARQAPFCNYHKCRNHDIL